MNSLVIIVSDRTHSPADEERSAWHAPDRQREYGGQPVESDEGVHRCRRQCADLCTRRRARSSPTGVAPIDEDE